VGEFYSVALTNNRQQADTGTKMIHIGKNTRSTIVSKGISAGYGQNTYRGQVKIMKGATGARNYTQCDSLLIGDKLRRAHLPLHRGAQRLGAHGARGLHLEDRRETSSFISASAALKAEDAVSMIVNGFCKTVFKELPMEFAVEAQKLLGVSLEGSVG
jgi:Fe-S cluster assembly protein SufB